MSKFGFSDRFESAAATDAPSGFADQPTGAPNPTTGAPDPTTGPAAVDRLTDDLGLLRDQAAHYLGARLDQVRLAVRRGMIGILLGFLALLVGAAVLATAAVLTVAGIAGGVAELLGQGLWLGQLVTGLVVLALVALGIHLAVRNVTRSRRWETINRYAELHRQQLNRRGPAAPKSTSGQDGK